VTDALPVYAVRPDDVAPLVSRLGASGAFLRAQNFAGAEAAVALLPGPDGLAGAVLGLGSTTNPMVFGALPRALPATHRWYLEPGPFTAAEAELGFRLGGYGFDRLKSTLKSLAVLAAPETPSVSTLVEAIFLARDLINTPANLLGPAELADAAGAVAERFGASCARITGAALDSRYPVLAAVGAGSARKPEVVILSWAGSKAGADAKFVSLCGKGVCFDTGGYDLKPSAAMLKMKKDMGGAAILLGVAQAVMALDLPVRLELRLGCVENSISGSAMRPSDVVTSRTGTTIEIGNTDAEGRLVLCDLLAEAAQAGPDWLIDAATLTGAARVALGPDLPALFCSDDAMAAALLSAGQLAHDPLWRLPLFEGYLSWLDSPVADTNTVSAKPFAGAIIAALFLRRFVPQQIAWAHIDVYAWNDSHRPGRPEGGEAQSLRALVEAIRRISG
jgi:leucyl aminopeptidase